LWLRRFVFTKVGLYSLGLDHHVGTQRRKEHTGGSPLKIPLLQSKGRTALAAACALLLGTSLQSRAEAQAFPPAELGGLTLTNAQPTRVHVAQAADTAQLAVRVQQLEEQVRSLNGQIEGLTFQLTQMQTLIERQAEETNARLQGLGAGGSAAPATPAQGSAAPSTEIPPQGVRPLPGEAEFDPTFDDGSVGSSSDPLAGTGQGGSVDLTTGQPLDLSYDPEANATGDADADAQFTAGYEAIVRGDYAFAEDQFSQFIELYPDNAQATDAANWLGEALIQREAYDQAAEVLLDAFQKSPDSPRSPDLLLRLGVSLAGAEERETACRTYAEIERRYTTLSPAFAARLAAEKTKAECPPA
jgi:tol-pal system protein YbgF